jgi:hypothetical protein
MPDFKNVANLQQTREQSENIKVGMTFRKILTCEISPSPKLATDVARITTDDGTGKITKYHTTSKPLVAVLRQYFITDKQTAPLENLKVVEIKSATGRMYFQFASSI